MVQVTFDPAEISFDDLLHVFFTIHDPTTLDRQGNDVGPQYRSAIFVHDEAQREAVTRIVAEIEAAQLWPGRIVTEIVPFVAFYAAGPEHADYFARNPWSGYCRAVIAPKVLKFRKGFARPAAPRRRRLRRRLSGGQRAPRPRVPRRVAGAGQLRKIAAARRYRPSRRTCGLARR